MSPTFASLSVRNYRVYAAGGVVSNTGTWMGRVAQDWVVLTQLTDHSATALGIVTGLQFLPMMVLAPWAGSVIDRVPKRALLMVSQAMLGLAALVGGVLVVTGSAQLWHFYLIALATGNDGDRARVFESANRVMKLKRGLLSSWPRPWKAAPGWRDVLGCAEHREVLRGLETLADSAHDPTARD